MSTINVNLMADSQGGSVAPISSVMRNRIINGSMVLDQRNAGAGITPTSGQYLVDRWAYYSSQASKFTSGQGTGGAPTGFSNYYAFTSASAYSLLTSDFFAFAQSIEGFNVADLGWGTANARTVTLSFLVFSSLTGTFGGALRNSAANRSYPFTYSVPVANTWTSISITIAGDTTGTWLTNNGTGIFVSFGLGVGSSVSGTAGAWAGANLLSATGAISVVSTSGATFYITGVQFEKGTQATSFEYRQYGQELALCQRYFRPVFAWGTPYNTNACVLYATVNSMRTSSPTVTLSGLVIDGVGAPTGASIVSLSSTTTDALRINITYNTLGAVGFPTFMTGTTSTEL
jgi:hypothetical protein